MSLKLGEFYIVVITDSDGGEIVNDYYKTGGAVACIKEAIEEDGIDPSQVRVWKGTEVTVEISMKNIEIKLDG